MKRKFILNYFLASFLIILGTLNVNARQINKTSVINDKYNDLIIYQIMVESYQDGDCSCDYNVGYGPSNHKGDLKGIIKALPYIGSLGVNAIWLTPIFDSGGDSRIDATGYYCKDYFRIDPKFGTIDDARNLVNKAHELGLYVFFDGVFGHHKKGVAISPRGNKAVSFNEKSNSKYIATDISFGVNTAFPASLDFYKEVATYWIDQLGIDGWRLDQCYQLSFKGGQNKNYWKDIREAVEEKCLERKRKGEKWGTLGYMVGEDWEDATDIQKNSYSGDGLQSAFDFPSRYDIVRMLACDCDRKTSDEGAKILSHVYSSPKQKGYSHQRGVYPNLFISNHDLVRFGNLLNWRFHLTKEDDDYWKRHQCALAILAAYNGPITIYYGDEYGDFLEGYDGKPQPALGIANDNAGRTNGKCFNFTKREQKLVDYTKTILSIRKQNPALYKGTRINLVADSALYADLKINGNNKIIFAINISKDSQLLKLNRKFVNGRYLVDLENNATYSLDDVNYIMKIPSLSSKFYLVK
ncbi:MAG: alpha-amylase family glycosyl hydrolase [Bacteroides sp.]|nr:alpha-amylase family glycosyl hydrolase [Bacteroides sp.]MCI1681869.1 alpha-amylase family glycosyl hydrolase [Bacteroides sp.]